MDKEELLLSLVSSGVFEIDAAGCIWRIKTCGGSPLRGGSWIRPCLRHRAEYRSRSGYLLVCANINGRRVATGAHRLVWAHRHGPIPNRLTINHLNGVKDDNRPENLELATYSEQRRHALDVLHVNRNRPTGSKHPKTHLQEEDVIEMRRLRQGGLAVKEIAARYCMKPKAVSAICRRRTWLHV